MKNPTTWQKFHCLVAALVLGSHVARLQQLEETPGALPWPLQLVWGYMKVSKVMGVPLNHPFIDGFSIGNYPFWGTIIYENPYV